MPYISLKINKKKLNLLDIWCDKNPHLSTNFLNKLSKSKSSGLFARLQDKVATTARLGLDFYYVIVRARIRVHFRLGSWLGKGVMKAGSIPELNLT